MICPHCKKEFTPPEVKNNLAASDIPKQEVIGEAKDGIELEEKEMEIVISKSQGGFGFNEELAVGESYYLVAGQRVKARLKINSRHKVDTGNYYRYSIEKIYKPSLPIIKSYDEAQEEAVQICKVDNEKQIVTGAVLVPDKEDLQGDSVSAEEIEKAMINYMTNDNSKLGWMHDEIDQKEKRFKIIECFCAPQDLNYGKKLVRKGTWIISVKYFKKDDWDKVKSGVVKGFSISGLGKKAV